MSLVTLGSVLVIGDRFPPAAAAHVGSDAHSFVENLHRCGRRANLYRFMHQVVGHAVQIRVEGHVIIDIHFRL